MNEPVKPMCYSATDLKDSIEVMLRRHGGANYADLNKNRPRIQALGKAREKQEKVIATVRARLAAAEGKAQAHAVVQQERLEVIKQALVKGERPDPKKMSTIAERLSELDENDEDFPCSTEELRAVLAKLEDELKTLTAEHQGAMRYGMELARTAALDEFAELEVHYQDLMREVRQTIECMFVQGAIAGAFFDPENPQHLKRTGNDTRNPTMLKAQDYLAKTSAVIGGHYAPGLRIEPVAVLAAAEADIERIVRHFSEYGALSVTPIGTPRTTQEAMRKRVEEIEKNRQLMGF